MTDDAEFIDAVPTDYLEPGINGLMTEAGDAPGLARTIAALSHDADQCKRLGNAGHAFASVHCVEENVVRYFDGFVSGHASPNLEKTAS